MDRTELTKRFKDPIISRTMGGIIVEIWFDKKSIKEDQFYLHFHDQREDREATGFEATLDVPREKVLSAWRHPFAFVEAAQRATERLTETPTKVTETATVNTPTTTKAEKKK